MWLNVGTETTFGLSILVRVRKLSKIFFLFTEFVLTLIFQTSCIQNIFFIYKKKKLDLLPFHTLHCVFWYPLLLPFPPTLPASPLNISFPYLLVFVLFGVPQSCSWATYQSMVSSFMVHNSIPCFPLLLEPIRYQQLNNIRSLTDVHQDSLMPRDPVPVCTDTVSLWFPCQCPAQKTVIHSPFPIRQPPFSNVP